MPRILPNPTRTSSAMPGQSYDDWLREKVSVSLEDPRPSIPHETVMKRLRAMLVTMEDQDRRGKTS